MASSKAVAAAGHCSPARSIIPRRKEISAEPLSCGRERAPGAAVEPLQVPPVVLGVALMSFPVFVSSVAWMVVIGVSLTGGLWLWRD